MSFLPIISTPGSARRSSSSSPRLGGVGGGENGTGSGALALLTSRFLSMAEGAPRSSPTLAAAGGAPGLRGGSLAVLTDTDSGVVGDGEFVEIFPFLWFVAFSGGEGVRGGALSIYYFMSPCVLLEGGPTARTGGSPSGGGIVIYSRRPMGNPLSPRLFSSMADGGISRDLVGIREHAFDRPEGGWSFFTEVVGRIRMLGALVGEIFRLLFSHPRQGRGAVNGPLHI